MKKIIFFTIIALFFLIFSVLANSLDTSSADKTKDTPIQDEIKGTSIPDETKNTPISDEMAIKKKETVCGDGICEPPEAKDTCCEDCGGCNGDKAIKTDKDITGEKSFFGKIIDFFRRLFG